MGHRLITIFSSYNYAIYNPFGGGLGNWFNLSIEAINLTGIDISKYRYFQVYGSGGIIGTRSSGFISNLILETGFIGLLVISIYLYNNFKKYWKISKDVKIMIIIFLINIFFISSVGHPVSWIIVILYLRFNFIFRKNHIRS